MRTRILLGLLIGSMVTLGGLPGFADEEPADKEELTPSPLADMKDEHYAEEAGPQNTVGYLASFRDWLATHETPPPRTKNDTALWDIWRAALHPRATRMRVRIEKLMARRHWLPVGGTPEAVRPASWSHFVREIAGLTTELDGAWKQYARAQIRIRRGIPRERLRPLSHYYGYGHPVSVWRAPLLRRHRIVGRVGPIRFRVRLRPLVLRSYWNLMHRYRLGWQWRVRHCYECEARRREAQKKKLDDFLAERQRIFDTTRDTLEQQMIALRVLVAAMQAQAEDELGARMEELGQDVSQGSVNAKGLVELRDARVGAEQFKGTSSAAYGQLLRGWSRVYNRISKRLGNAEKAAQADR